MAILSIRNKYIQIYIMLLWILSVVFSSRIVVHYSRSSSRSPWHKGAFVESSCTSLMGSEPIRLPQMNEEGKLLTKL